MTVSLSVSDVSECSGYTQRQIQNLCSAGVLLPESGGRGKGCHRLFSLVQAVGLAFACRFAKQGAGKTIVVQLLDRILDLSEDDLLKEFDAGRTHVMLRIDGPPIFMEWEGPHGELFDIQAVYDLVVEKIDEIQERHKDAIPFGRLRGSCLNLREAADEQ